MVVDDYSRFTWVKFLMTKDEVGKLLITLIKQIENWFGNRVTGIRSDHGTKFENSRLDKFCAEERIHHNFSAPRTPQQNRVIERKNRILVEIGRTMLIESRLAKKF